MKTIFKQLLIHPYPRHFFAFLWILVSFTALISMYSLWWTRERVLYLHKTPSEQRELVFKRAGLPLDTLAVAGAIDQNWPGTIRFTSKGSEVGLSYMLYLLIPRIPSGSSEYRIEMNDSNLMSIQPRPPLTPSVALMTTRPEFDTVPPTAKGLVFSLLVLCGLCYWISVISFRWKLSIPENMAIACGLICLAVLLIRGFTGTAEPAFQLMSGLGMAGWLVAVFNWRSLKSTLFERIDIERKKGIKTFNIMFLMSIIIMLLALIWSFLMAVVVVPDDWDAWAQWGPKAKLLAVGQGPLSDVRYFVFGSGDYPLLWPAVWAFSGWLSGGWEEQWSKGWGTIFLLLCAWQMSHIVFKMTGRMRYGIVLAGVFLSMPAVPLVASWAYAEAPFLFMTTCAWGRLLSWRDQQNIDDLWLAGLFASLAAHTKNEGVLFALLALGWLIFSGPLKSCIKRASIYCLSFLVPYLPWFWYVRIHLGIEDHATRGIHLNLDAVVSALHRIIPALSHILSIWSDIRQWNLVLLGSLFVAFYLFIKGDRKARLDILFPVTLLAGFLVVMLFHPSELHWQLGVAWNRLTIQALCLLLLAECLSLIRLKPQNEGVFFKK